MSNLAVCFIDMPFGKKKDLANGVEIDFDRVYELAIEPAIIAAGLEPIRGDRERTGGVIHIPMFGRLLLSDYVIADMTLANANVFYELGIRHTAKPFTTVPIFAEGQTPPFDVGMVRAIPYALENGQLSDKAAAGLKAALLQRLRDAIEGTASKDSPLFQLIPGFPAINLPHSVTEIFQDKVRHSEEFRRRLDLARARSSDSERLAALREIQISLGNLKTATRDSLVELLLSYRDVSAWDAMVQLYEGYPDHLKSNAMVKQQYALALNRRNQPGDRDHAIQVLQALIKQDEDNPETRGILGRVHKDRYRELKAKGSLLAEAALDDAIDAYTKGFESDPRDYYPGVNAVTLLIEKGDEDSLKKAGALAPMVSFAVARQGGADSSDYWTLATVLELSAINNDWPMTNRVLAKTLGAAKAAWMAETTLNNLTLLKAARSRANQPVPELDPILAHFQERYIELKGAEPAKT